MWEYDNQRVPNSLEVLTKIMNTMASGGWQVVAVVVEPTGNTALVTFKRQR